MPDLPSWRHLGPALLWWFQRALDAMSSPRPLRRWTARAGWAWSIMVVVTWLLLITTSESFLPATLLAYGPRYVLLAPFVLLLPAAVVFARSALAPLTIALLMVLGPIMGGRVSLKTMGRTYPDRPPAGAMRVISFNARGGLVASVSLRDFVARTQPDIIAMQECGEALWDTLQAMPGWHRTRYANLCTASRWPIASLDTMPRADFERVSQYGFGGTGLVLRHVLTSPRGPLVFVNLHLETARKGLESFVGAEGFIPDRPGAAGKDAAVPAGGATRGFEMNAVVRDRESERAAGWSVKGDLSVPSLIAGDFNLPVESAIFRRHWGDFVDAFDASGTGFGWTKREGALLRVRIDHILGTAVSPRPIGAWVGPALGSDHLPVIADLAWRDP